MIVDSHVHFWDPAVLHYGWLNDVPVLNRAFGADDYAPMADGSVRAALFVEANCDAGENEREVAMIDDWARNDARIAGIVAFVDLLDVAGRDATLARFKAKAKVVGIRHNIQGSGTGFCTQREFVNGVRGVGESGFVFDICATADQLGDVQTLVEQCEQTEFVLDHCGKPDIAGGDFSEWTRDLDALARLSNMSCKLSGLLTQANTEEASDDAILAHMNHALNSFGAERVLYGSDWPVCSLNGGAGRWRSLVERACDNSSIAERDAVFGRNAIRVYKLSIPGNE